MFEIPWRRQARAVEAEAPQMEARVRSGSRSPNPGSSSKEAKEAEAAEEQQECVICCEELNCQTSIVKLPCNCTASYCHLCWDRSLAASVFACGRALCPSCRCPMSVDYDPVQGRLLFERASPTTGSDGAEMLEDTCWRDRLYKQARPMQIKLLQLFGAQAEPSRAGPSRAGPGVGSSSVAEDVLQQQPQPPKCVCGSRLMCVSVRERILASFNEAAASPHPSIVERLMLNPPIVCDICVQQVQGGHLWTCENGRRTVLHAVAYDVCEACFAHHTQGEDIDVE
mmetsp:Transcript_48772/g.106027  ORF Transcript_48772/g.106027 Transcript_48772/m.106027 type:complete len:283 (+) Transcript_48772:70-918(+)